MKKNYQKILNDIGNTYKDYISISIDLPNVNIKLDEFAQVKLELKNATDNIAEDLNDDIRNLSSVSFVEIKELRSGYLISMLTGDKRRKERYVYFCEDIGFDIEFYDYSKIEISEDEIIDNYRVRLAVKEARNLLAKHALLGDEGLNQGEKDLIKKAMFIVLLNSSQYYEVCNTESICDIYDLFLKYDNKYEKKEFLEASLEVCKLYEGEIEEIEDLAETIESYLDIQNELDKNIKNTKSFDFEEFQEQIDGYQDSCYYYKPMYKIYADFSIGVKNACRDFKDKNQEDKNESVVDIENYINEKILPKLKENGFEGKFPAYRYKDDKKIYLLKFIVKNDKVQVASSAKKITAKKMIALLKNIDYEELEFNDLEFYSVCDCKNKKDIDASMEDVLDDLDLHKDFAEFKKEIREVMKEEDDEEDFSLGGFMSNIFAKFKKKK